MIKSDGSTRELGGNGSRLLNLAIGDKPPAARSRPAVGFIAG
jgi:hypothetical protein